MHNLYGALMTHAAAEGMRRARPGRRHLLQPQGHVQVVMNHVDFHLDPQQALDAPRWQWLRDGRVTVECRFDPSLARALERRGHRISVDLDTPSFGRGQMIVRLSNGVLVGGTESRTDSNIALF